MISDVILQKISESSVYRHAWDRSNLVRVLSGKTLSYRTLDTVLEQLASSIVERGRYPVAFPREDRLGIIPWEYEDPRLRLPFEEARTLFVANIVHNYKFGIVGTLTSNDEAVAKKKYEGMSRRDLLRQSRSRIRELERESASKGFETIRMDGVYMGKKDPNSLFIYVEKKSRHGDLSKFVMDKAWQYDQEAVIEKRKKDIWLMYNPNLASNATKINAIIGRKVTKVPPGPLHKRMLGSNAPNNWSMTKRQHIKGAGIGWLWGFLKMRFVFDGAPKKAKQSSTSSASAPVSGGSANTGGASAPVSGGSANTGAGTSESVNVLGNRRIPPVMTRYKWEWVYRVSYKGTDWSIRPFGSTQRIVENVPSPYGGYPVFTFTKTLAGAMGVPLVLEMGRMPEDSLVMHNLSEDFRCVPHRGDMLCGEEVTHSKFFFEPSWWTATD